MSLEMLMSADADAPVHYKDSIQDALNNKFQQGWIGRGVPV